MKSTVSVIICALVWAIIIFAVRGTGQAAEDSPVKSPAATLSAEEAEKESQAARANESSPQEQIAKLIDQLGDKDYFVRQRAQEELSRLGFEAFDALMTATTNDDLEIASRAKYLLRLMRVEWTAKNDPPEVQKLLKDYELQLEETRRARMHALVMLSEGKGVLALCRLMRFEKKEALSKAAVIELLRSPFGAEPPQGDRAEAIRKLFDKSRRPSAAWMLTWLKLANDPQEAMEQWQKLIDTEAALLQRSPAETSAEILSGLIRYQISWQKKHGQTEQALAAMHRLIDLDKGDLDALVELLDWLAEQKDWKVIEELAGRFTPRFDAEPVLLYSLAEAQKEQGQTAKAEETAQRAFRLNMVGEEPKLVNRYLIATGRLLKRGLIEWAIREYKFVINKGRAIDPATICSHIRLSEIYHDQGEDLAAGAILEAMFKATGANFPNNLEVIRFTPQQLRGWMYYYQACHWASSGDHAKQGECLDKALVVDPENIDVLIACYRLPEQTPEYRKKIVDLIRDTAAAFQVEIAAHPDDASLYNQYAWLIGNTEGNLDEALKYSHKSLELMPDYAAFYDTLARVYYAKKDYDNAVKYQQRAAELEPHSGLIAKQLELFRKAREEQK